MRIPQKGDEAWNYITSLQYQNKALERQLESFKSGKAYVTLERKSEHKIKMAEQKRDRAVANLEKERKTSDLLRKIIQDTLCDIYTECEKEYKKEIEWNNDARVKACAENVELRKRNKELKESNRDLKKKVYELEMKLEDAEARIVQLTGKLNMDSTNSSKPSSTDEVTDLTRPNRKQVQEERQEQKQIHNSREKTDRKPGGQPGHPGHSRRRLATTTDDVILEVPDEIKNNPDYEPYGEPKRRQRQNVRFVMEVTDYVGQAYRNRKTGEIWEPEFPADMPNEVNYGYETKAKILYLTNVCNVAVDKVRELFLDASDGQIQISTGTIQNTSKEFAKCAESEVEEIHKNVIDSTKSINVDTTNGKVNKQHRAVSVCGSDAGVVFKVTKHKGQEVVDTFGLDRFVGPIISDCEISFMKLMNAHQMCLAHINRKLKGIIEIEKGRTWALRMRKLLQTSIHEWKEAEEGMTPERIEEIRQEFDRIIECADREYNEVPPSKYNKEGANLRNLLRKYRKAVFLFLEMEEVEPTNNRAERWLRNFKRKMKQMGTFRSDESMEDRCAFMSIYFTAKEKGENVYRKIENIFKNRGQRTS